jgi:hypothetical protein
MRLSFPGCALILLVTCAGWLSAQSLSDLAQPTVTTTPTATTVSTPVNPGWVKTAPTSNASTAPVNTQALPATQPAPAATTASNDSAVMSAGDFLIDGVPYAKVLYLEGTVWIRPPTDTAFHLLTEDEPIALHSVISTGANGILDFATGPGMAVRMVPQTFVRVAELPQPASLSTSTSSAPETSILGVKKGMVFSALGRSDGEPIDFEVRTPQGVAGARGTMFATEVAEGQSQVSMLHGTVNFRTPDYQTSQISAGQSQQISGTPGGKFQLGRSQALNPAKSADFFNHAGGLLEHASGYGVVRRGLGPDVANTLRQHGYALPAATQQRFQNAAKVHYQHRPGFHNAGTAHPAGAGTKTGASTLTIPPSRPSTTKTGASTTPAARSNTAPVNRQTTDRQTAPAGKQLTPAQEKEKELENARGRRRAPGDNGPAGE